MSKTLTNYLSKCLWVAVIIFAVRIFAVSKMFESLAVSNAYSIFGCIGEAICVTSILMILYERVLWRVNPFEKTPKIHGMYEGEIEYQYGDGGRKAVTATVKQSLLTVKVFVYTNEISSRSINSIIMDDGSEKVLLYTYITNPESKVRKQNPIAYGTCRMSLEKRGELKGSYWTSQSTVGDISLLRKP